MLLKSNWSSGQKLVSLDITTLAHSRYCPTTGNYLTLKMNPSDMTVCLLLLAGVFGAQAGAVDYVLGTDTRVDYESLKSGFSNPPEESKLSCFWFWQCGLVTKESITQDLEAMKAMGYGGALIGDNGAPEEQVGPVFMSDDWKDNLAHAVRKADRLELELSLNIQSGWGDPGRASIRPISWPTMATLRRISSIWKAISTFPAGTRGTCAIPKSCSLGLWQEMAMSICPTV